jgi:NADPH:quinone reductase-like Zn-dependent oxidoreductase
MKALSLNYRDLAIARGHYHAAVDSPLMPISDGAGEVVAVAIPDRKPHLSALSSRLDRWAANAG